MPREIRAIHPNEVYGMVHRLPWARSIQDWPTDALQAALDAEDALTDSPRLAAAIHAELAAR